MVLDQKPLQLMIKNICTHPHTSRKERIYSLSHLNLFYIVGWEETALPIELSKPPSVIYFFNVDNDVPWVKGYLIVSTYQIGGGRGGGGEKEGRREKKIN